MAALLYEWIEWIQIHYFSFMAMRMQTICWPFSMTHHHSGNQHKQILNLIARQQKKKKKRIKYGRAIMKREIDIIRVIWSAV